MAFTFRLEHRTGRPPTHRASHGGTELAGGDTIPLSAERMLRVIETRLADEERASLGTEVARIIVVASLQRWRAPLIRRWLQAAGSSSLSQ